MYYITVTSTDLFPHGNAIFRAYISKLKTISTNLKYICGFRNLQYIVLFYIFYMGIKYVNFLMYCKA